MIANEESVENYHIENSDTDTEGKTLTQFLDSYLIGSTGLEDYLNSLYFKPDYTNAIPLSCFYELDLKDDLENVDIYLVNVATKFLLRFKNYRPENVTFNKVSLNSVADFNYLIPQIEDSNKKIDGVYWIDWLKEVSKDTSSHPNIDDSENSNGILNEKWGWIKDYDLPKVSEHKVMAFSQGTWEVETSKEEGGLSTPGVLTKGPFYFPESKNTGAVDNQEYSIEFEIETPNGNITLTRELEHLKTLFRNTNVIIDIEMNTTVEEIYVEIKKWVEQEPAYGIVVPEES